MPKRILWFSRHPPMAFQIPILKGIFGEDMVLEHESENEAYMNAVKIIDRIKVGKFDEIIMVAPLSVIDHVIRLGRCPIKADVVEVKDASEATFSFNSRHYKFIKFVRVMRLELVTEDL